MTRHLCAILLSASFLLASSCAANKVEPVKLSSSWPGTTEGFRQVRDRWTRFASVRGTFRDHLSTVAKVWVTLKSPEWRASYVDYRSKVDLLSKESKQLLEGEHQAANDEFYEVQLFLSTYLSRENDLQRRDKSVWRVALVNDQGQEVEPVSVKRDRTPRSTLYRDYPVDNDHAVAYTLWFPKDIEIFGEGKKQVSFKFAGSRGQAVLVWSTTEE